MNLNESNLDILKENIVINLKNIRKLPEQNNISYNSEIINSSLQTSTISKKSERQKLEEYFESKNLNY